MISAEGGRCLWLLLKYIRTLQGWDPFARKSPARTDRLAAHVPAPNGGRIAVLDAIVPDHRKGQSRAASMSSQGKWRILAAEARSVIDVCALEISLRVHAVETHLRAALVLPIRWHWEALRCRAARCHDQEEEGET